MPCTYVVHEVDVDAPGERPFEWYQRALEITVEMIEWVLAQPDLHLYRLAWSS